jgi:hypothetical protein
LGNPHAHDLKALCQAYGRASETERVWVDNDGLDNRNWPKIQSTPLGKLRGIQVLTRTKRFSSYTKNKNTNTKCVDHSFFQEFTEAFRY